jgi:hypothetical protein
VSPEKDKPARFESRREFELRSDGPALSQKELDFRRQVDELSKEILLDAESYYGSLLRREGGSIDVNGYLLIRVSGRRRRWAFRLHGK